MNIEFTNFEEILQTVKGLSPMPTAVIDADKKHVPEGACEAARRVLNRIPGYFTPGKLWRHPSCASLLTGEMSPRRGRYFCLYHPSPGNHR
jgi:hypothetical protein